MLRVKDRIDFSCQNIRSLLGVSPTDISGAQLEGESFRLVSSVEACCTHALLCVSRRECGRAGTLVNFETVDLIIFLECFDMSDVHNSKTAHSKMCCH